MRGWQTNESASAPAKMRIKVSMKEKGNMNIAPLFLEMSSCTSAGSGMVFKLGSTWHLRGLASLAIPGYNGKRCDTTHYVIFTDLAKLLPWINDTVFDFWSHNSLSSQLVWISKFSCVEKRSYLIARTKARLCSASYWIIANIEIVMLHFTRLSIIPMYVLLKRHKSQTMPTHGLYYL